MAIIKTYEIMESALTLSDGITVSFEATGPNTGKTRWTLSQDGNTVIHNTEDSKALWDSIKAVHMGKGRTNPVGGFEADGWAVELKGNGHGGKESVTVTVTDPSGGLILEESTDSGDWYKATRAAAVDSGYRKGGQKAANDN